WLALAAASCASADGEKAAPESPLVAEPAAEASPAEALLAPVAAEIAAADAVFFGEAHDDRRHHELETATLAAMAADGNRPLILGLEMFQRPFQDPLDDYVGGRI